VLREGEADVLQDTAVTPEMFRGESREVYEFIVEHYRSYGVLPKVDTVLAEIDVDEDFIFDTPEPSAFYASKVIDRDALNAQREKVKEIGTAIRERDPKAVHEAAKNVVQVGLDKLQVGNGVLVNLKYNGEERWERYQKLCEADGGVRGFRGPWEPIDNETGGFKAGDLVTIVARLGLGKTFNAILNAVRVSQGGARVGFVSPEMSRSSLELRRDAITYRLPYRDLLRGELDFETSEYYREQLHAAPTDDIPDWFIAAEGRVRDVADAEMFVRDTHIEFLVVDGIYLLNAGNDRAPWHERVMMVTRGLKELALRCQIPILCTAQFNRSVRTGATRGGTEAIGHTDAIGQFSDVIIGMFQDENMRVANQMLLRLLKNRDGSPVELTVNWDLTLMDFSPLTGGPQEANGNDDDGAANADQDVFF
jgi:replicative DNA helicase